MRRLLAHAGLAAALFAAFAAFDTLKSDETFDVSEFVFEDAPEWLLLASAIACAAYLFARLRDALVERKTLTSALGEAIADGEHWRATARVHAEGLGRAIRQQFARWRLTAGESDVAMLMLKGLSHKEIGRLRQSSSATVRQQAAAVYLKSGLSSRAELAAFFLEDLFPSEPERSPELSGIRSMPVSEPVSATQSSAP
jgi:DNA-binding NarL/FixJ family response regulator